MPKPPQMPPFSLPPHLFNSVPHIGQQPSQQAIAQSQIHAAIGQLAMQIFARAAAQHVLAADSAEMPLDDKRMKKVAKDSIHAAKYYFEALGATFVQPAKENENET